MNSFYLDAIRKFEGFTPQAQWDYAQISNGYGTRALFPGEVIDRAEAERRFMAEIAGARAIVERHAPNVDEGTKAALTSLTFNAGDKWVRSGLGDAVRRGDMDAVRSLFLEYTKAGGKELQGLVDRRSAEAQWIGNGSPAPEGATTAEASRQPAALRMPVQLAVSANQQMAALMRKEEAGPQPAAAQPDGATAARGVPSAGAVATAHAGDGTGSAAVTQLLQQLLDGATVDRVLLGSASLVRSSESLRLRAKDEDSDAARQRSVAGRTESV
ncbi:MAG: glycoside hydrolase family protein [Bacteroidota bacterium]